MTTRFPARRVGSDDSGLASVLLPPVVHEASAAVLVVDLSRREVTYANELAREFAPGVELPLAVDQWSADAGLEDVSGIDLPDDVSGAEDADGSATGGPAESLMRVANGYPVTGEAVTARRATAATAAREVLWVVGLPLVGAPDPMSSLALVVFLPARNARLVAGVLESATSLRDRAVLATRMSFTITDPRRPDDPLIWVNPAFTATTGYEFDEVVGHNCRFLQGPDTDRRVVAEIAASLRAQRAVTTTLLNYRKDGTPFWNELSISPVRDNEGDVTHFVGVQADVTARVQAQQARDDALSQVAQAADRLALLADFTSQMAMSQHPQQVVELLAAVLVPRVASWCAVYTYDQDGRLLPPHITHERAAADADIRDAAHRLHEMPAGALHASRAVERVLRGEVQHVLIEDYAAEPDDADGGDAADDDRHTQRMQLAERLGVTSLAVVPLLARGGLLGCVALAADDTRERLGEAELALSRDLAVRAGLMLENTQLYARERRAAATLQRSLLPRLPRVPGMEIAALYVPAADEAAVGGDWYDVFTLRDSTAVAVVVGDVMGHNIDSAARMGKLSTIVRSYGWPGTDPYQTLGEVDRLLEGTGLDFLATCFYGQLERSEAGATLRYVSAGHPPALIRAPDGNVSVLDGGRRPMLGISGIEGSGSRPADTGTGTQQLPLGSTLICFTDGLVDAHAPDETDPDAGMDELCRRASGLPAGASPQAIVDELSRSAERHKDDVAVVAIRIG